MVEQRFACGLAALFALALIAPGFAAETPKHGGILNYVIPADAPPSFDGHRETTFATLQTAAPSYSVLIRVNPENPSSTTDFVCDLCTEIPTPTGEGDTYTFKIRFQLAARGHPERTRKPFHDGRRGRRTRPVDRGLSPEIRDRCVSARARGSAELDLQKGIPR